MTGPWPGQMVSISCASASACRRSSDVEVRAQRSRRDGPPPSCRGRARCRRSARPARRAARTTASRRCGRASRRRAPRGRRPPPRHRRRGPPSRAGTPGPGLVRRTRRTPRTRAPPPSGRGGGGSAGRRPRRPAAARTASRCAGEDGPGSTTTDRDPPGSRSTHVLVPSRVIGEALGGQHAHRPRPERRRPTQVTRAAAPPACAGCSGIDSDAESPEPSTSGMNISTGPRPAAAASTSRGEECSPTSRQVR